MLIIRHLTGPLAGKVQRIEAKTDRVTFGRDPDACDVVFPPDATIIARRHFALARKPSGEWTLDLFGDPYVAVNGETGEVGQPVHSGAKIELGKHGGPSFEVLMEGQKLEDALPPTLTQEAVVGSRTIAQSAQRSAGRARRVAILGTLVALLLIGAGGVYYYNDTLSTEKRLADAQKQYADAQKQFADAQKRFSDAIKALDDVKTQVATDRISKEKRDLLAQAVYLVLMKDETGAEKGQGTAFAIGPHMLGTNAHVAQLQEELKPGQELFVRGPGDHGKTYKVIALKMHAGYKPLEKFLSQDPLFVETIKTQYNQWGLTQMSSGNGYDVGILIISDKETLSPVLELATPEEAMKLAVGDPLAYAGYPMERITGGELQVLGPTPQVRTGSVTAETDLFSLPADPPQRRLIHHDMALTGGASGSPVISSSGKVVALINSMNVVQAVGGGRMPSAALINYAQRVDLLVDLISGMADKTLEMEKTYWTKQTANLKRGADVIVTRVLNDLKPTPTSIPVALSQAQFSLTKADQARFRDSNGNEATRRQKQHKLTLTAGKQHVFVAYAQEAATINLYLLVDGKIIFKSEGSWYPNVSYKPNADTNAEIYITGADKDATYMFTDYGFDAPKS